MVNKSGLNFYESSLSFSFLLPNTNSNIFFCKYNFFTTTPLPTPLSLTLSLWLGF